jgi:hypothetical protein
MGVVTLNADPTAGETYPNARRQYDAVEPENRLVARTLERALEAKLAAQQQAERDLLAARARRPVRLTDEELAWLSRAGADVRAVFAAPSTTFRERKQLLRAIISEVVVTVDTQARTAALRIIWQGGACTELDMAMAKTGGHFRTTDEDTIELVRRLATQYDDTTIALILSRQRRRTGTGLPFTKSRVYSLRVSRGIPAYQPPKTVAPNDDDAVVVVTVAQAERLLGVGKVTDLPVAAGGIHHRRTTHRRGAVAHPHRPGRTRPSRSPGAPRLRQPRQGRQDPRSGPPDGVA